MSVMVVVLLGGLWALILLPGAWRERRYGSPLNSVNAFELSMSRLAPVRPMPGGHVVVLERPDRVGESGLSGRPVAPPAPEHVPSPQVRSAPASQARPRRPGTRRPSPETLQRRRQVLGTLAVATALTGILGLWIGGIAWFLFLLAYVALVGYVALLAQLRARRDEVQTKVHHLTPAPAARPLTSGVRIRTARGA